MTIADQATQRRNLTFSKTFSATALNRTSAVSSLGRSTHLEMRRTLVMDPTRIQQFLAVIGRQIHPMTRPVLAPAGGDQWVMAANMSNIVGRVTPISIPRERFEGRFTSLASQRDVEAFALPVSGIHPDTIEGHPDETGEPSPPGLENLSFEVPDEEGHEPRIVCLPLLCPVAPEVELPQGSWLVTDRVDRIATHAPYIETWRKAMAWTVTENAGRSIGAGGPIFNPAAPELAGEDNPIVRFGAIESVDLSPHLTMLGPGPLFDQVELLADTMADAVVAKQAKGPPADGSGSETSAPELIKAAIAASLEARDNASTERTSEEKAAVIRSYQLAFGTVVDTADGPMAVPAELTEEFKAILVCSKQADAHSRLRSLLGHHFVKSRASDNRLSSSVTLTEDFVCPIVAAVLRNYNHHTRSLNHKPELLKTRASAVMYASPKVNEMVYRQRLLRGERLFAQVAVGEDASRLDRKTTELYIGGWIDSVKAIQILLANFKAVFGCLIKDFDRSMMWECLAGLEAVLNSEDGRHWAAAFCGQSNVGLVLLVWVQDIMASFFSIGSHYEYLSALKQGQPIDPRAYLGPKGCAKFSYEPLLTAVQLLKLTPVFHEIPLVASFLPQCAGLGGGEPPNQAPVDRAAKRPKVSEVSDQPPEDDRRESDLQRGFLEWTGTGKPPACEIRWKAGARSPLERICLNFVCKGLSCKYRGRCRYHHPISLDKVPESKRAEFVAFVNGKEGLSFAPGRGPPGM